ncbi:6-phosphogluconolactonase [endosymbiont of Ridgeia piscesae]|jgi:6-phosphogluconolactonase|nr:6-phosphogluconolactonase [endosymbiont of Ridgeia piscesae]
MRTKYQQQIILPQVNRIKLLMAIEEREFESMEAAAHVLADELACTMRDAITKRGRALLAVSGGRTPQTVFNYLCKQDIDWASVTITLTDERWVPVGHTDSNESLVRDYLLQGDAADATFIPFYGGEATPELGRAACEARLTTIDRPFDAVYIGMGEDGHFLSLFPGDAAVEVREGRCVAVPETKTRLPRMSLTASFALNTKNLFLLFSGAAKHAKYAEAKTEGLYSEVPLRLALLQKHTPVHVLTAP